MQWLIDMAIAAMKQYLVDNPRYVDRGDPVGTDWTGVDFISDGTWRDLDLSAIVPAGAKAVLFDIGIKDAGINADFYLRKKGNINIWNRSTIRNQVANLYLFNPAICACDEDRFVQYWITAAADPDLRVTIRGWWL